jgi:hypothetical protein
VEILEDILRQLLDTNDEFDPEDEAGVRDDRTRLAIAVEDSLAKPRAKLEVTYVGVLDQFELRLVTPDGTARVVRSSGVELALTVMADEPDLGALVDLDGDGELRCPNCRGVGAVFEAADEVGRPMRTPGGLVGRVRNCPCCREPLAEAGTGLGVN